MTITKTYKSPATPILARNPESIQAFGQLVAMPLALDQKICHQRLSAAPQAKEFLLKAEKTKIDCELKMKMLNDGHSADEIVQSILSRCEPESTSQRI